MIVFVSLKPDLTERVGSVTRKYYHCNLQNGTWSADVSVDIPDTSINEAQDNEIVYTSLASSISSLASAGTGSTVTVLPHEIRGSL